MSRFARVASRLFNAPLMLRPEKAEMLCAALVDRLGIAKLDRIDGTTLEAAQLRHMADEEMQGGLRRDSRGFYRDGGTAIIRVDGTLVHKLGGVDPWSGMVGFDQITTMITSARNDDSIGAIVLDIDSPGGEVSGCFECGEVIYQGSARNGGKPVFAFANEMACSAAYLLASACDRIATTATGIVGSIGVWTMLVDMTKGLDKNGFSATIIRAGDRKARGGPYEKADAATVEKLQSWVNETWQLFAEKVSEYRGLDAQAVLGLRGDWFTGGDAFDQGLIDAVASAGDVYGTAHEEAKNWRSARR